MEGITAYQTKVAELASEVIYKGVDYSQVHVAQLESAWSLAYRQEASNFVADQWFPLMPVRQIAGIYPKWAMENGFTPKAGKWRPGSVPVQGELKVDTPGLFACERWGFEMPLMADLPFVADPGYSIEYATTQMVTDVMQLNKEIIVANNFFKDGVWGFDWSGVNSGETWTDGTQTTGLTIRRFNDEDSTPLKVFKDAKLMVKKGCGQNPNTIIMGEPVYEALRVNSELIALFRNPQGAEKSPTRLNKEMMAMALDVDKIIVAGAVYNTAAPGATCTLDWIFGKHLWYGYVTQPGPLKTIAGMNLSFNEPFGGFDTALVTVPDLHVHTTWYQGFQCFCPSIMATKAGLFIKDVIA